VTTCYDSITSVAMWEDYDNELVQGVTGSGDCTLPFIWMASTYHK